MKQPPLAADPPVERIGTGIACLVAAAFCFSVTDALAKWLGQDYAAIEILFFRYLFGMLPVAVLIWYGGGLAALRTRRPGVHALRAGLLFLALYLFFEALQHIPLADAIAAAFTAPLFITAMSGPVLGETVGFRRWAAVLAGFIGALIILRPGSASFDPAVLLVLGSALSFSVMVLLTRRMIRTETNVAMVTYSTLGAFLASLPFLVFVWRPPASEDMGLFLLLGIVGGIAAYVVVVAYRNAPVSVLAPFDYTTLIWGVLFGWLIWNEQPALPVWIGAALVCASGVYIARRESKGKTIPHRKGESV
ncbi:MAG: DMT family transporter [Alphaproteobacteria bacterium]|jgi:drug/metabolite transporter (DMT)-like permease